MTPDITPYDAVLLVVLRRTREARRTWCRSWRTSPGAAASRASGWRRSASTTSASAGRSPINDQNRAFLAALREDLAGGRHRPAGLLGQPQLGPLPHRHGRADGCRRRDPGGLLRHQRVLVVLLAAGSTARTSSTRSRTSRAPACSTSCGTTSTTRASWSRSSTATLAALADLPEEVAARRAPGLRHPLDPRLSMNDAQRPAGGRRRAYVEQHLERRRGRWSTGCGRRPAAEHPHAAGVLLAVRLAADVRGWSRTSTTTSSSCTRRARPRCVMVPDRLRLRPHGGRLRPRHRGAGDRRAARPPGDAGPRPPAWTRASSPWCATCCWSGPPSSAARRSPGAVGRHLGRVLGPVPGGLLRQPARRPPGAARAPTRMTTPQLQR